MHFIVWLASCLNGVCGKYIEHISAELLMEGQNVLKCLCACLPAKKHYSLDTATIVENWTNAFLHIKNTFRKPSEAFFFWLLQKIASFWFEALCFENKRAEPRHVTMIYHCGILLFINAKATNTRKLTYNCC